MFRTKLIIKDLLKEKLFIIINFYYENFNKFIFVNHFSISQNFYLFFNLIAIIVSKCNTIVACRNEYFKLSIAKF